MKINYRQMSILIFLSFLSLKLLALPSLLYIETGTAGWFVTLALMTLDVLYALMIVDIIKMSKEKSLISLLDKLFGKVVSRIIILCLVLRCVVNIVLLTNGLEFFIVENLYTKLNWLVYILPMLAIVGFMMYKGVRNIGRVSELIYVVIVVGCLYIAIKSISAVTPYYMLPFFKDGVMPVVNAGYHHVCWFGSSTFLLLLLGKIDFQEEKKKKLVFIMFFALVLVMFIHFVFYCLFDVTSAFHGFAISDIGQYNTNSTLSGEITWLVVSLWIIAQIVQIALYGYCAAEGLRMIFGIKNNYLPVVTVDAVIFAWCYASEKTIHLEDVFFNDYVVIFVAVVQYLIPLFIFVANLIRNKAVNHEKVKAHI